MRSIYAKTLAKPISPLPHVPFPRAGKQGQPFRVFVYLGRCDYYSVIGIGERGNACKCKWHVPSSVTQHRCHSCHTS